MARRSGRSAPPQIAPAQARGLAALHPDLAPFDGFLVLAYVVPRAGHPEGLRHGLFRYHIAGVKADPAQDVPYWILLQTAGAGGPTGWAWFDARDFKLAPVAPPKPTSQRSMF